MCYSPGRRPLRGAAPGRTLADRYQYEFRLEGRNGQLNPFTGVLNNHNDTSIRLAWAAAHTHPPNSIQFRVRARAADGSVSGWVTSPVLTEDRVNPVTGPFSRAFSRAFPGGGG